MRTNNAAFEALNQQPQREIRLVVEIEFDGSNKVFFTSHSDITGISGTVVSGVVKDLSSVSQKLDPINAVASIGNIGFQLVDKAGAVTTQIRAQDVAGRGLRGKTVRLYSGFKGLAWANYRLEQTQVISQQVTFDGTEYKVTCADIQRELRKDIFEPAKTKLATNFLSAATTMTVYDTTGFELNPHGPSYSDAPGTLASPVKVGYLKLKYQNGWEIVRYTGKTSTTFTGITRGVFNTKIVDHTISGTATEDNGVDVEEYIYIELPAPKLLHALQTGTLLGQPGGSNTLPTSWHCGIAAAFADATQVQNIGDSWYKAADDTGFIVRFDGLTKTDGKAFMEKEVCLLMGAFMPINGAGKIGLRLMQKVLAGANYVTRIGVDDIVKVGDVVYNLSDVHNEFDIQWGYYEYPGKKEYFRRDYVVDAASRAKHSKANPTALKFKGLHASRHSQSTVVSLFNGLRDRYAGPPIKLNLQLLPSKNNLEIGDTVFVDVPQIRDFTNTASLSRTFEVQSIRIDQTSQRVSVDLFGSTMPASAQADLDTGFVLPDAWYISAGSALANVSAGQLTADTTVTGGSSLAATIRYVNGDLLIPSGRTLTLTGNVQLRVRGFLDVRGSIVVSGGMAASTSGVIGTTQGDGAVVSELAGVLRTIPRFRFTSSEGPVVAGRYTSLPSFPVEYNGSALVGVPDDLRGSGGAQGGSYTINGGTVHPGGAGGAGGGGCLIISRGGTINAASGVVNLSGANGSAGTNHPNTAGTLDLSAGSGAGGAPGAMLWLIDGNALTSAPLPVNGTTFIARHGTTPTPTGATKRLEEQSVLKTSAPPANTDTWYSYYRGTGGHDAGVDACFRVQYIPKQRAAAADYTLFETIENQVDGVTFSETFSNPNALENWEEFNGLGDLRITTDGEVTTGGKVLSIGDNSGNDMAWRVHRSLTPFDATKLYRIRARVKRTAGSGTFYLGICGVAADGVTLVNVSGSSSASSQHYFGAAPANPGASFQEFVGYFKGHSATGGGYSPTWSSPGPLHTAVRYLRALFIANYSSAAGTTIIDYVKIEEVPIDSLGRPTELFSGDTNATNGAPAGTLVGGVDSSLVARPRPNLVRNPCGYLANRYWSSDNSLVPLITESYNEGKYWYVTSGQVPTYKNFYTEAISVSAGETYTLSFRGYRDSSTNATIGIYYYNSGGGQTGGVTVPITVSGGWASYSVTGAAPAGTTFARIVCNFDAMAGWGYAWTKIKLEFGSAPSPFTMERSTNLVSLAEGDNVVDRYSDYLFRDSGDATPLRTIINRINNSGRPANQRFLRAFHAPGTQAVKAGGALSASDAGSTATITIPSWSIETDVGTISYNSGSVTGLSFSTKYYVYCTDSDLAGGAVTYVASTDYKAPSQNADRVFVGSITTPADGGGGTGGGSGGGEWCVAVSAWLPDVGGGEPWRAAFAAKNRTLWVLNETDDGVLPWPIRSVEFALSDCVTLVTESGIRLTISVSTPITLKGGRTVLAPACLGLDVPVLDGKQFRWEEVTEVHPAGLLHVARIHADQLTFAAGDQQHRYILTHNPTQKP